MMSSLRRPSKNIMHFSRKSNSLSSIPVVHLFVDSRTAVRTTWRMIIYVLSHPSRISQRINLSRLQQNTFKTSSRRPLMCDVGSFRTGCPYICSTFVFLSCICTMTPFAGIRSKVIWRSAWTRQKGLQRYSSSWSAPGIHEMNGITGSAKTSSFLTSRCNVKLPRKNVVLRDLHRLASPNGVQPTTSFVSSINSAKTALTKAGFPAFEDAALARILPPHPTDPALEDMAKASAGFESESHHIFSSWL